MPGKNAKPKAKQQTINVGGKSMSVPVLSAPVGTPPQQAQAKYPVLNQPGDVEIIDHYLGRLENLKALSGKLPIVGADAYRLATVINLIHNWHERDAAIAELQRATGVTDAEELAHRIIKPRGQTLMRLVGLGEAAERLLRRGPTGQRNPGDYIYRGSFDRARIARDYPIIMAKSPKFGPTSLPQMLTLLSLMEDDTTIIDIRWMAYMLATAMFETTKQHTVTPVPRKGPKKVLKNFSPVEETQYGKGLGYNLAVKVRRLPDGSVMVTEQDGNQWTVSTKGVPTPVPGQGKIKQGSDPTKAAMATYLQDPGLPFQYYGRGYVQLTWWEGYARAGIELGCGWDILFNPALALEPDIAYKIMATGMLNGTIFAHDGHRFTEFFVGMHTDYTGARAMVNPKDTNAADVGKTAQLFEELLLAAAPPFEDHLSAYQAQQAHVRRMLDRPQTTQDILRQGATPRPLIEELK